MKRIKEMETLSWEHHHGLVVVFRLQKGLQNNADPQTMREYVLKTWDSALAHHFWQEEEILIEPLQTMEQGRRLVDKMLQDHEAFRQLIEQLNQNKGNLVDNLTVFASRLNNHIRFEERELFAFVQQNVQKQTLLKIGDFLHQTHKKEDRCPIDEFWK